MRPILIFAATAFFALPSLAAPQTPAAPRHDANFDSERKQADDLYLAQKPLEALPLYEDLSRQDPTIAVFAERHGAGLFAKEATISDPSEKMKIHQQGVAEIKRAQSLGDNSAYVRGVLSLDAKTYVGSVLSGIPLTAGYTYHGKPAAQAIFQQAENAFGKSDWTAAAKFYTQAAGLDPTWYDAALYAGDSYFRLKDARLRRHLVRPRHRHRPRPRNRLPLLGRRSLPVRRS